MKYEEATGYKPFDLRSFGPGEALKARSLLLSILRSEKIEHQQLPSPFDGVEVPFIKIRGNNGETFFVIAHEGSSTQGLLFDVYEEDQSKRPEEWTSRKNLSIVEFRNEYIQK